MTPGRGSAGGWASAWNSHGWQTSNVPIPGAIAWTSSHVAYVKSVNGDGTVNLEEYNWGGSASYHTRTVPFGAVSLYLYPPP
jgi:peptidoglycan DL-endopeptidase CwlO